MFFLKSSWYEPLTVIRTFYIPSSYFFEQVQKKLLPKKMEIFELALALFFQQVETIFEQTKSFFFLKNIKFSLCLKLPTHQ